MTDEIKVEPRIGLALSGGGSRAIAFHLGSMKALDEFGILERVEVISAVSGGSIIGSMWAYHSDSFDEFEARVKSVLKRGFVSSIVGFSFHYSQMIRWPWMLLAVYPVNAVFILARVLAWMLSLGLRLCGFSSDWVARVQPPLARSVSRTTAFELALERTLFPGMKLNSETRRSVKTRKNVEIVINACEMRTGTAFRFGNRLAANYPNGEISTADTSVARAVAGSAAFPILLPALDCTFAFKEREKMSDESEERIKEPEKKRERVMLTDGGVYDNLGISLLRSGRDPEYSSHTHDLEYILCSSAGQGRPDKRSLPYWFLPRMIAVSTIQFRKLQDAGLSDLFDELHSGNVEGFALSYLGHEDTKEERKRKGWVKREKVVDYPTDFFGMDDVDAENLIERGHQLMRSVLEAHCPKLLL